MSMGDFDVTYGDGTQSKIGVDQYFNYETKVKVEIKEAKAEVETKQTEKTEKRKDTLTFDSSHSFQSDSVLFHSH